MNREQRLRIQAELQSLTTELQHLRQREAEHLKSVSGAPQFTTNKIRELRQRIIQLEDDLQAGEKSPAQELYRAGFAAELLGDTKKAIRLYKQAARKKYPDADAALRSMRYDARSDKTGWLIGLGILAAIAIAAFIIWRLSAANTETTTANKITPTLRPTLSVVLAATRTPAPLRPSNTPRPTATNTPAPILPTNTPPTSPTETTRTEPPEPTPTETPVLQPAPKIIGPPNNLVWQGGTIVFEFEAVELRDDELYCLDTLRGFDNTGTENWSYPQTKSKTPSIPVDANVFSVAKTQGIQCVTWQAYIGQSTCHTRTSELTPRRIIGLPDPCDPNSLP
ncbi:MAG: hypothetical protein B6243_11665 [Anaerolineaceae bacterium 4572_5.2]|nr:MAG: hypothetical protein B6243_11665 [Anaerolineaceae bacterium 4572_5.2]